MWAATRIAQGWTYGARRDDAAKHHPCLVPYDDLTDEEREFDRNTSLETIKEGLDRLEKFLKEG